MERFLSIAIKGAVMSKVLVENQLIDILPLTEVSPTNSYFIFSFYRHLSIFPITFQPVMAIDSPPPKMKNIGASSTVT
jgi:hypothetical protein